MNASGRRIRRLEACRCCYRTIVGRGDFWRQPSPPLRESAGASILEDCAAEWGDVIVGDILLTEEGGAILIVTSSILLRARLYYRNRRCLEHKAVRDDAVDSRSLERTSKSFM